MSIDHKHECSFIMEILKTVPTPNFGGCVRCTTHEHSFVRLQYVARKTMVTYELAHQDANVKSVWGCARVGVCLCVGVPMWGCAQVGVCPGGGVSRWGCAHVPCGGVSMWRCVRVGMGVLV